MADTWSKAWSKLLVRLEVNDDDDRFSSTHQVLSANDYQIILPLPSDTLHLSKSVCKQWLSLITSPTFTSTPTRTVTRTVNPPSGLFIARWSRYYECDFVSFDPRIAEKMEIDPTGCLGWIENSCNGLLLGNCKGNNKFVCNPTISSMFKILPPMLSDFNYKGNGGDKEMHIAFDPSESPFYKVVHAGREAIDRRYRDYCIRIQTYSSGTGVWRLWDDRFEDKWFSSGFDYGIYWNGAIRWLNVYYPFHVISLYVVDDPVLSREKFTLPITLNIKEDDMYYQSKLSKSNGSLLLLCIDNDNHLNIFEMKNVYSGWSVKYIVNYHDMIWPYPMPSKRRCRHDILSIVLKERDEDSFMVITTLGKMLKYEFGLETVTDVFDMGEESYRKCFEYTPSFAHV